MRKMYLLVVLVFFFACATSTAQASTGSEKEKSADFFTVSMVSKIAKQEISFKISLPKSYYENIDKSYPVFITTSGGSRQDVVRAQVKWLSHVDFAPIPEVILITMPEIDFDNKDKFSSAAGGQNEVFAQVLSNEVFPFIDENYRSTSYRTIEGFSSFGNFPLYMLRNHSDVINAFLIFSPAFSLDKSGLVDALFEEWQLSEKRQHFVFLSLGTFTSNREHFERAKKALSNLTKPEHSHFEFADYSQDNYLSGPNIGLIKATQLAFADLQPDYLQFHEKGEVALAEYFENLGNKYGEQIDLTTKLVDLSFSYAAHDKYAQAKSVMTRLLAKNTDDILLHIRMAQIQINAKKNEEAKLTLKKASLLAKADNDEEAISYVNNMLANLDDAD